MNTQRSAHPAGRRLALLAVAVSVTIALAVASLAPSQPAAGHAAPETSDPPAGATVPEAPGTIAVIFSEEVAAEGTDLTVIGPDGNRVDQGDSTLDLNDMTRQRVPVGLQPDLGPGTYTLMWRSLSAEDGDTNEGSFTFSVGAPSTPVA